MKARGIKRLERAKEERITYDALDRCIYPGAIVMCPVKKVPFTVPEVVSWFVSQENNIICTADNFYICAGPNRWCTVMTDAPSRNMNVPERDYVTVADLANMVSLDIGADTDTTKRIMYSMLRAIIVCCDNEKRVSIHGFGRFRAVEKPEWQYRTRDGQEKSLPRRRYIWLSRKGFARNLFLSRSQQFDPPAWSRGIDKCPDCNRYTYTNDHMSHKCMDPLV